MELLDSFILIAGLLLLFFGSLEYLSYKLNFSSLVFIIGAGIAANRLFHFGEALHITADIGIILLFFLLGLEFPLNRMREILSRSWPAGVIDLLLNAGFGFGISHIFGLDIFTSLLIGSVIYATSSSITLKLLEDKKRMANRETEFILALLIFEDLVAPIMVSFFAAVYGGADFSITAMFFILGQVVLFTLGAAFCGYFLFRRLGVFVERHLNRAFLPLFTVGIALGYAGLAMYFGLSEVLGAFLAGIMLSETEKAPELENLILPLRHLILPFFFFWFGTGIHLEEGVGWPWLLVILVFWSFAAKLLTGFLGGRLFGLRRKTAFRGGFSMVQRGEFSAILAALAPVKVRSFAGVYIILTAFLGLIFFEWAPELARLLSRGE
ncbi:MAG: cation:proton antiporter [Halanaerobiales bacterium]